MCPAVSSASVTKATYLDETTNVLVSLTRNRNFRAFLFFTPKLQVGSRWVSKWFLLPRPVKAKVCILSDSLSDVFYLCPFRNFFRYRRVFRELTAMQEWPLY